MRLVTVRLTDRERVGKFPDALPVDIFFNIQLSQISEPFPEPTSK